jgi:hypothetical protein
MMMKSKCSERRFVMHPVLIWPVAICAVLLSGMPLHAYECVDKEQAQRDYDAAKEKLISIQKERTKLANRDQVHGIMNLREIKAFLLLAMTARAKLDLDKIHDQEEDAAFKKWYQQKRPSEFPDLYPSQIEKYNLKTNIWIDTWYGSEEKKQFELDFADRWKEVIDDPSYRATVEQIIREGAGLQVKQYYALLDHQQDKYTEILRAAHECMTKGPSGPPTVEGPGPFIVTVDPHGPPRYVKANAQVEVQVLIGGGTPPYNLSLTSAIHNIKVPDISEAAAFSIKIPLRFPQPGTYQVSIAIEDSSLPRQAYSPDYPPIFIVLEPDTSPTTPAQSTEPVGPTVPVAPAGGDRPPAAPTLTSLVVTCVPDKIVVGQSSECVARGEYSDNPGGYLDLTGVAWDPGPTIIPRWPGSWFAKASYGGKSAYATVTVEGDPLADYDPRPDPGMGGGTPKPGAADAADAVDLTPSTLKTSGTRTDVEQPGLKPPPKGPGEAGTAGQPAPQGWVKCHSEKTGAAYYIPYGPCPPPSWDPPVDAPTWQRLVPPKVEKKATGAPVPSGTPTETPTGKSMGPKPSCGPGASCKCAGKPDGHISCETGKCNCVPHKN